MDEPKTTRGENTRREILTAAKRLFLSQGFSATPMRQVAREAGITPAAIYNHYPSKDHLFTALLQNEAPYDELFGLVDEIEADSAEDLLRQVFRTALALVTNHQSYLHLALIDAQERDGAALATLVPAALPRAQTLYRRLVALEAAQPGRARLRQIPFVVFGRTLISMLMGFMLTERVAMPALLPQLAEIDWMEAVTDVLLHGMLTPIDGDRGGAAAT